MEKNILQENQINLQQSTILNQQQQQQQTVETAAELNFIDDYIQFEIKKNNHLVFVATNYLSLFHLSQLKKKFLMIHYRIYWLDYHRQYIIKYVAYVNYNYKLLIWKPIFIIWYTN